MKLEKVIELMLVGRVFELPGIKMMYKNDAFNCKTCGSEGLIRSFGGVEEWKLVEEWYDNIPECGILCRTSDTNSTRVISLVHSFDGDSFIDEYGLGWENAEPLNFNSEQFVESV